MNDKTPIDEEMVNAFITDMSESFKDEKLTNEEKIDMIDKLIARCQRQDILLTVRYSKELIAACQKVKESLATKGK